MFTDISLPGKSDKLYRNDHFLDFLQIIIRQFTVNRQIEDCLCSAHGIRKCLNVRGAAIRKGKSKIRLLTDGSRFFLIITKVATLFSPLRVFLPVSVALFITGICYYAYTFVTAHRFSNMSALLLSTSIIIFMMGLISEQITQLRYDRYSSK